MSDWDPAQYARFRAERRRPFFDLLDLVEARPEMRVVDLGCGTGELTRQLHHRLRARETLGIDSSAAMLAASATHAGVDEEDELRGSAGVRFESGDLADLDAPGAWDLVFSNAALHWLPDHATLLARLTRSVAPTGQLAVQVPANHDHASHVLADEIAAEPPFRDVLDGYQRGRAVLAPSEYALILRSLGYRRQLVRLQVYVHELASVDDVVEWVKGTLLTDYQRRMSAELFAEYLERYRTRLRERLGNARPFYYAYDRTFMWASEPATAVAVSA
jgi:trans-aconitate 2-methyltransferase